MRKIFTFLFAALMSAGMFAQLATPVISGDEEFTESTTITITCASAGVDIFYSLDGSNPGNGDPYTGPITITETTTVKAQAFNEDGDMSAVAEKTFTKKAGASATTEVTITQNDFPQSGQSFTKDGVTVSAYAIDGMQGNIMRGGSFSTTLGNFTQIEVSANDVHRMSGEGWSGDSHSKTWTGNASSVSFSGDISGNGQGVTLKFTIEAATVAVTGVTLNQSEAQMTVGGETLTLTATVNPDNATDQSVSWSTSDANVATVDNGVVTAVAAGNATITVTTTDGSFTATCAVTVTAPEPEPQPTTVTWGATEFSSFGVDYLHDASRTVKGITVTVNAANNNFINVTEVGTLFNATIDNAFTFSTELGNITKIECTTIYTKGSLGDGWTIGANSATWEGNTNTLNFGNAGSMLVVSNIIFTIGDAEPEPEPAGGLNIVELTPIPASWADDESIFLTPEDLPGFKEVTLEEAMTWTTEYTDDAILFYGFSDVGRAMYVNYWNGEKNHGSSYCYRYMVSWNARVYYTTGGGAPEPQPAEDVNITPNVDPENDDVYYSTFYDSANKYALPDGVEAYVATRDGANLLLSKIADAGQTIPADNAVILKSSVTPFTLSISDAEAVSFNAINSLQGTDVSIATPANCYVLAGTDGVVGFYHYTAANLNAHKAYVVYSGSNQAPKRMPFVFNQATGVESIQPSAVSSQKVLENGVLYIIKNGVKYNAQGQVVK